jgi:hypothetical protein
MTPETLVLLTAVLAIINGETATAIVNWLKKQLGIVGGVKAMILTAVEVSAVTAGYLLLVTKTFGWGTFAACALWAFLRASGIYTDKKAVADAAAANPKA